MLKISKELNIEHPSDWGNISVEDFSSHGGSVLLEHYGSIQNILRAHFSGRYFPSSYNM